MKMRSCSMLLIAVLLVSSFARGGEAPPKPSSPPPLPLAAQLGIAFDAASSTTLTLQRDGKTYLVDVAARTITEVDSAPAAQNSSSSSAASQMQQGAAASQSPSATPQANDGIYRPGDDRLFTLPSGRRLDRHGFYFNFTHRFPYEAAFHGPARGHTLLGLDEFALASFGFSYGVTSKFSLSAFRSPSVIGRPIQLRAAYNLLDERDGQPFNAAIGFAVEGQNDFQRNFITSFELIASRSLTQRAQLYFVPTVSLHNRPVLGATSSLTDAPPYQPCSASEAAGIGPLTGIRPCANTVALGAGLSVDVRPTVALIGEVNPTVVNGRDLGIHRPVYSFAIQKKIWRHAFTLGFTNGAGVTLAERSATRATFLRDPSADKPSGLFIGFDLTRQIR